MVLALASPESSVERRGSYSNPYCFGGLVLPDGSAQGFDTGDYQQVQEQ